MDAHSLTTRWAHQPRTIFTFYLLAKAVYCPHLRVGRGTQTCIFITEVEPVLLNKQILMLRVGSPVFCRRLTEFLLAERGPVPSAWCHSPTAWPPAGNRQMGFSVICLSSDRETVTEEHSGEKCESLWKRSSNSHLWRNWRRWVCRSCRWLLLRWWWC